MAQKFTCSAASHHNHGMAKAKVCRESFQAPAQQGPQASRLTEALAATLDAFREDLDHVLSEATEYARRVGRALDGVTLLTKAEAAKRMTISIANLDRKVASGEIEATYLDRRIRFKLTEVLRFIDLRTGPSNRKRRRGLS
jgi:hypothetical protein